MVVFVAGRGPERVSDVWLIETAVQVLEQFKYQNHITTRDLRNNGDIERERRAVSIDVTCSPEGSRRFVN